MEEFFFLQESNRVSSHLFTEYKVRNNALCVSFMKKLVLEVAAIYFFYVFLLLIPQKPALMILSMFKIL